MKLSTKITLVLSGFTAALVLALIATYIQSLFFRDQPGGMYAEGEGIFFFGAWGLLSLFPAALALFFLRSSPRFWVFLSWVSLALAATAPLAETVTANVRHLKLYGSLGDIAGLLALIRVISLPILAPAFALFGVIAPNPGPRRLLWVCAGIESLTLAYVAFNYIFFHRLG